jgi:cell division protein FtsW
MVRNIRINLFITTVILICIGIVMIYSASSIYAWEKYNDSLFFLKRHIVFLVIGALLTFLIMGFDYRKLKKIAKPFLIFSLLLLVLVLIPGICVLGLVALLILMQPDLGTTLAIGMVVFIMLFVSGVRLTYLLSVILSSLPVLYLLIFSVPYRRMRILAFLNPWLDPKGSGFQIIQSQVALGSGGMFGVGLGHSRQKLFYLPAAHTDFIFSIIGEELGLVGTLAIVILFILFIQQGLKVLKNAPDKFGYFLSLGLVLMISLKAIINIGVSCGLLPTKGLPLPFISYGGSSLIFDILSVGLLINIARTGEYP